MDLAINLITATSKILWPILGFSILLTFKKEISEILRRFKKGKVLGQEIELSDSLEALRLSAETTKTVTESIPNIGQEPITSILEKTEHDEIKHILDEATKSPRVALITLSGYIEIAARRALASTGTVTNQRHTSPTETMEQLSIAVNGLPHNIVSSTKLFMTIRNKLIHTREASEDDIISALDSGITILRAIKSLPIQKTIITHTNIPLFQDPECETPSTGLGVIFEIVGPGGIKRTKLISPTLLNFEVGQSVSWEWHHSSVWNRTWYIDPVTQRKSLAWDCCAEFIGRSLDSI